MSKRFLIWLAVLVAVWTLANLPRDLGSLKYWIEEAGFPWIFATWDNGRLTSFNLAALTADIGVLLALVSVVGLSLRWRHRV